MGAGFRVQYSNYFRFYKRYFVLTHSHEQSLAHTCKYDKTLDSKPLGCHFERSETSSIDFKINTKTIRTHKTLCKAKYV
ncbi:hypothetical protein [Helicobacter bilis]|uniref:hypothetical protein n=1 Tax=Helicobacter bilis TaxID=37372 RepID=UPI00051DB81D|nr:hypothetical protein [Helicobacter bilis]